MIKRRRKSNDNSRDVNLDYQKSKGQTGGRRAEARTSNETTEERAKELKLRQEGHAAAEQQQETPDGLGLLMVYAVGQFMVCTPLIFCYAGSACFLLQWSVFISSLNLLVYAHHLHRQKQNKRRLHGKKENKNTVVRSLAVANLGLLLYFILFFIVGRLIKYTRDTPEISCMLFLWNGVVEELADILTLVNSDACPTYGTRNNYPLFIISDPCSWPDDAHAFAHPNGMFRVVASEHEFLAFGDILCHNHPIVPVRSI